MVGSNKDENLEEILNSAKNSTDSSKHHKTQDNADSESFEVSWKKSLPKLKKKYALIAGFGALVISSLFGLRAYTEENQVRQLARTQAIASINKDFSFRKNAAKHGGFYVPITEHTQPNPYLNLENKVITDNFGRKLTLLNPAYLMRQLYEGEFNIDELPNENTLIGRITSLNPINPINTPYEWEKKGLQLFEKGVNEYSEIVKIGSNSYLRVIKPVITLKECLKCHEHQGYKLGDIRGGISTTVNLEHYIDSKNDEFKTDLFTYLLLLGLGSTILGLSYRNEKKEKEESLRYKFELRQSNLLIESTLKRYQAAINHMGEGFAMHKMVFDENNNPVDYIFLDTNPEFHLQSGIAQEVIGKTIKQTFPENIADEWVNFYAPVVLKRESIDTERFDDATNKLYHIKAYPLYDNQFVVMFKDITENRRLEDTLHHAQKMEDIGAIAGGIAHDFNNILTVILGYCEIAKAKCDNQFISNYIAPISDASNKATTLVRSLLNFSRKKDSVKVHVNLDEIVIASINLIKPSLEREGANASLEFNLEPGQYQVMANASQLDQVLLNLITNAVYAVKNKDGKIALSLYHTSLDKSFTAPQNLPQGNYVVFSVKDNGAGIEKNILPQIFDSFFTTKKEEGTGLGLSTVYRIVKSHDGIITVDSTPGVGTEFKVYLPLANSNNLDSQK